jgi:hypothetical protein
VSGSARCTTATFAACFDHGAHQRQLGLMEGQPFGENGVVMTFETFDESRSQRNAPFSCSTDPDFGIGLPGLGVPRLIDAAAAAAAAQLSINLIIMSLRNPEEIECMIDAFAAEPNGALLLSGTNTDANRKVILHLALQHRLPTMFGTGKLVAEGLLMSNGPDFTEMVRGASSYVARILRGENPSDLPVQFPTRVPLVINLKTAKALELIVPQTLLATADQVIE